MTHQGTIARNLAAVGAHFHSEANNEVEQALDLYADDVVWEAPARNLIFRGGDAVAANYRIIFGSVENVEMRLVHIFEMRDGKISKEIAFEMPHAAA